MSILHTVNKTPAQRDALRSCLAHVLPGSAVLLLEDGVYAGIEGTEGAGWLARCHSDVALFALEGDLRARAVRPERLLRRVKPVGYRDFVELAAAHDAVQAWL